MGERFWREPLFPLRRCGRKEVANAVSASDAKEQKPPRGEVHIIEERCKGCGFCVEFCPKGVLAVSEKRNPKGHHLPYVKDEETCVICGLCEVLCPDFAIFAVPRQSAPDENPENSGSSFGKDSTG